MKTPITPAMSIRFGAFFGQSDTFWHGIQVECDFRALARRRKSLVAGILAAPFILHPSSFTLFPVLAIRNLLPTQGPNAAALSAVFGRKSVKRKEQIASILATLEALGKV